MTEVIMPKMGDGMEEGTLVEWLKKDGDSVKSGEIIGTIQTDKATLELEAPGSGVLSGFLVRAGETVPVGKPIAAILKSGEKLPGGWGTGGATTSTPASENSPTPAPEAAPLAVSNGTSSSDTPTRIKASPLAKKIAAERGVDLSTIVGTGPGGRIVEKDIPANASSTGSASVAAPKPATTPTVVSQDDQILPLNRLRKITGERTLQSKTQVPHFYVTVAVDIEKILALRAMFEEDQVQKPSINDFVIRACALALRDMPQVNATFEGANLRIHGNVNIGIAVALDDALTVPVLKNADHLSLRQISSQAKALASKAKDNKLGLDELSGSTFSISNMGMLDVDNFVAIINQPNAAILAVASARREVVPAGDDEVEIRSRMNITGSFDHRVVDGASGAKFVNLVKGYLENPTRLLA